MSSLHKRGHLGRWSLQLVGSTAAIRRLRDYDLMQVRLGHNPSTARLLLPQQVVTSRQDFKQFHIRPDWQILPVLLVNTRDFVIALLHTLSPLKRLHSHVQARKQQFSPHLKVIGQKLIDVHKLCPLVSAQVGNQQRLGQIVRWQLGKDTDQLRLDFLPQLLRGQAGRRLE